MIRFKVKFKPKQDPVDLLGKLQTSYRRYYKDEITLQHIKDAITDLYFGKTKGSI